MKKTFSCFSAVVMATMFGMADAGQEPRLAQQFAEVESLTVWNLDRDLLVDPGVLREVNGTESAAAEGRDDFVFPETLASE